MTIGLPRLNALKRFRSSGKCHGRRLSLPITPFSATATMIEIIAAQLLFLSSGSRSSIVPRQRFAPQRQA
jgi:hypothetical protein